MASNRFQTGPEGQSQPEESRAVSEPTSAPATDTRPFIGVCNVCPTKIYPGDSYQQIGTNGGFRCNAHSIPI